MCQMWTSDNLRVLHDAFPAFIDFLKQLTFENAFHLQKFGPGVGTLPQLEPPVVQVVLSNAKNQQSENILPQIANRGGQNNNQTQVVFLFSLRDSISGKCSSTYHISIFKKWFVKYDSVLSWLSIGQDERPKPSQQFAVRFGTATDKVSVSRNSKIFSKKTEKDKSYEGQRLPLSPLGTVPWVRMPLYRTEKGKDVMSHIESFEGVQGNCVSE